MRSNKPLWLIAATIAVTLLLPTACEGIKVAIAYREAATRAKQQWDLDYWNTSVEPLKQRCLSQGGIPRFVDVPNTGRWDWQVECQYPPVTAGQAGQCAGRANIDKSVVAWIHNEKTADAELVRTWLRELGWECCRGH